MRGTVCCTVRSNLTADIAGVLRGQLDLSGLCSGQLFINLTGLVNGIDLRSGTHLRSVGNIIIDISLLIACDQLLVSQDDPAHQIIVCDLFLGNLVDRHIFPGHRHDTLKKDIYGKKNQKSSCKLCIFAFHFNDIAGTALSCHKIPPSESGCFNLFIIAFFSNFDKISA